MDRPRVCVFAPSPLLTVTVEAAPQAGEAEIHLHVGGQGFWVARMLAELDVDVALCSALGGEAGAVVRHLLDDTGIRLVAVEDGTTGAYVHDRRDGERTEVARMVEGSLSRHGVDDLYDVTLVDALAADATVLTGPHSDGVIDDDVYRRLTTDVRTNNGTVIADLSGGRMAAALRGGVDVLKVSEEELVHDGYLRSGAPVEEAMRQLVALGARDVVVSHGDERASALVRGRVVRVTAPTLEPVEARGAGDSMTAGLTAALARGASMEQALRLGSAAGALNVTRRGLGSGGAEHVNALAELVEIAEEASCERS